jgi:hypothetical protein
MTMKLFLDCEFTQLNQGTKPISLALVSEAGEEFYVEFTDTYQVEDCSEFVIENAPGSPQEGAKSLSANRARGDCKRSAQACRIEACRAEAEATPRLGSRQPTQWGTPKSSLT